jgi:hypothetical protein
MIIVQAMVVSSSSKRRTAMGPKKVRRIAKQGVLLSASFLSNPTLLSVWIEG